MFKRALMLAPFFIMAACESVNIGGGVGGTPQAALRVFCAFKQSSLATLIVSPDTVQAARLLCSLVGMGVGTPG